MPYMGSESGGYAYRKQQQESSEALARAEQLQREILEIQARKLAHETLLAKLEELGNEDNFYQDPLSEDEWNELHAMNTKDPVKRAEISKKEAIIHEDTWCRIVD